MHKKTEHDKPEIMTPKSKDKQQQKYLCGMEKIQSIYCLSFLPHQVMESKHVSYTKPFESQAFLVFLPPSPV